jgi:SAM-dependent methyltransferase
METKAATSDILCTANRATGYGGSFPMRTYDKAFYDYINRGSASSAREILPLILSLRCIRSVVDFGCGQGAWLREWKKLGVSDILGLDGDYVNKSTLLIEATEFQASNLGQKVDLKRQFDLVQSLEVAEHIPEEFSDVFVDNLARHGDIVFFSAAPIGQGGHDHINEKPYEYWRDKFLKRGYVLIDALRQHIKVNSKVEAWYRYNSFFFVKREILASLNADFVTHRISDHDPIPDVSPSLYQLRKIVISRLPTWVKRILAQVKKYSILTFRRYSIPK